MARRARRCWLLKTEPSEFGIDDLERKGKEPWTGVRNYRARNFLRDEMAPGDDVLFYHSSVSPPGVAGLARVASPPYPDPTQFDRRSAYHDPKASEERPRWYVVDVEFVERFAELVPLDVLKADEQLSEMLVTQRGQRLSVQPVERAHFRRVVSLGRKNG